ncbi:MAG TPA: quaternary ammonium compound efflux SMR transporter SugE [Limnochordales bacterium]|uniref:Quaternary ammonium compound efflux SMR transporter SugE n=1 Tax=Geochorda subterranea TaxID=3109564 RepID=A0ABZ1BMB6_9FIRM|nr:quaternary ammonium compound efflux SMR transporter SugE [Limnochorda sp. LNt]NLG70092.1 quaternary ammonium compound efflux SMR transporter SugE [Bacillota bacterium]WRP13673.1 quaternary ammonium compound efflux SMR transporter SugE [Limnochorda sp. LNt]
MSNGTAWAYLVVAGLLEVAWATSMKHSEGFRHLWPSVATIVLMMLSFALLSLAMRTLPLGTAYAVWTGIGAVGSVLVGMLLMGESREPLRLASIALILLGITGLRLLDGR